MGFFAAVGTCFRKYVTFSGRAPRAEYWWWSLFLFIGQFLYTLAFMAAGAPIVNSIAQGFSADTFAAEDLGVAAGDLIRVGLIASAFWLLTLIPTLAVTVRRLHDIGRSGGWILMPALLNGAAFVGGLMTGSVETGVSALDQIGGDALFGTVLMIVGGAGMLIMSIMMLVWMLKRGTRGENFFGPDPYEGGASYGEEYTRSYVPEVHRAAPAGADEMSHREQVSAIYRQRVLGKQGPQG